MSGWPGPSGAAEAWTHLDTQVLGGAAATITFSGIAAAAAPRLRVYLYALRAAGTDVYRLRLNNDSGGNYAYQQLLAQTAGTLAARAGAQTFLPLCLTSASIEPALFVVEIGKPVAGEVGRTLSRGAFEQAAPSIRLDQFAGEWTNTADLINRVDLFPASGNFAAGTRAVLEGAA
jgi:hypothetical protein